MPRQVLIYGGAALALVAVAFLLTRKGVAQAVTVAAVQGAGNVADGVLSGVVVGTGSILGLPETDRTQCQIAIANGEIARASVVCPAGTMARWTFNGFDTGFKP